MPGGSKTAVLLTFCNADTARWLPRLRREGDEISRILGPLRRDGRLADVRVIREASFADIERTYQDSPSSQTFRVFYFGGHANAWSLLMSDDEGKAARAHAHGLADYLGAQGGLVLAVLNGCATQRQVDRFRDAGIPAVIATTHAIADKVAHEFAIGLFEYLRDKKSLKDAFELTTASIRARRCKNDDPRELFAEDVDLDEKDWDFLWPWELSCRPDFEQWRLEDDPDLHGDKALLGELFRRRSQLRVAEQDTAEIDKKITKIQRKLRTGPALSQGATLDRGRFRLLEPIGNGGFAQVWKAYDEKRRDLVAVRVAQRRTVENPDRMERFTHGASLMAELSHPGIALVIKPEGEDRGTFYMVMEYIRGGSLHEAVSSRRLDREAALDICEELAEPLTYIHEKNLVHRDLNPSNILLREYARPVLADFDLVRSTKYSGITSDHLGTVIYAAPEQSIEGATVGPQADVYSLAMTALFCATEGRNESALRHPVPIIKKLPYGYAVRAVLTKGLAHEPSDRYASVEEFRTALSRARRLASLRRFLAPGLRITGLVAFLTMTSLLSCPYSASAPPAAPCQDAVAEVVGDVSRAWNPEVEERLAQHLGALDAAHDYRMSPYVQSVTDATVQSWQSQMAEVCTASAEPAHVSEAQQRRRACLLRWTAKLSRRLDWLLAQAPDAQTGVRANEVIDQLRDPCALPPVVIDEAVDDLLDHSALARAADHIEAALALARAADTRARYREPSPAQRHGPPDGSARAGLAAASFSLGLAQQHGGEVELAIESFHRASRYAISGGDDVRRFHARLELASTMAYSQLADSSTTPSDLVAEARAVLDRLGIAGRTRRYHDYELKKIEGHIEERKGDHDLALERYEASKEALQESGSHPVRVAKLDSTIGAMFSRGAEYEKAGDRHGQAVNRLEIVLGAGHPETRKRMGLRDLSLCLNYQTKGKLDEARAKCEASRAHVEFAIVAVPSLTTLMQLEVGLVEGNGPLPEDTDEHLRALQVELESRLGDSSIPRWMQANAKGTLGQITGYYWDRARAIELLRESIDLWQDLPDTEAHARDVIALVSLLREEGRVNEAENALAMLPSPAKLPPELQGYIADERRQLARTRRARSHRRNER